MHYSLNITETAETTTDDAEAKDLIMRMYNLLECYSNYFVRAVSFCFYFKNEASNFNDNIVSNNTLNL